MTKLYVGNSASISRVFTEEDVTLFAELSSDANPIHLDEAFAEKSIFGQKIVQGALVASLFSALLANELPGQGTIYLSQLFTFKAPCYIGQEVKATVTIINIREDKPIYTLRAECTDSSNQVLIEGEAVVVYTP